MLAIFDWGLILLSLFCLVYSLKNIVNNTINTIANYVLLIITLFNAMPILLNRIVGNPKYSLISWYINFQIASSNDLVNIVYDIYMILVLLVFIVYINYAKKKFKATVLYQKSHSKIFKGNLLLALSFLPIILVALSGNVSAYMVYGSNAVRKINEFFIQIVSFCEFIGIFSFFCWFFTSEKKLKHYIFIILYCFIIAWIDGKRYIIVTMLLLFFYFYFHSVYQKNRRIPIKTVFLLIFILFFAFYFSYMLTFRDVTNRIDDLYLSFRIDFGRDDITKFVLYRELILKKPIINYRGETIISSLLMFIPRSVWPMKPYPHYRYLTAALYNVSVLNIPAGMTPSVFEMMISNFGVFLGIIISCLVLVGLCYLADKSHSVPRKSLFLLLLAILLTQSLDAGMMILILLPINSIVSHIKFKI